MDAHRLGSSTASLAGFALYDAILGRLARMDYPHLLTLELEEPDLVPALVESKRFVEERMPG